MAAASTSVSLKFDDQEPRDTDALLLIHGHPFNRSMWRPQLDVVTAKGWRVIAPDLRGYGESALGARPLAFENFGIDLLALPAGY